jgi:hypothetical protein
MRTRSKLALAALTAAAVFGVLVAGASANRIATSNQSFRVTWNSLEFIGFEFVEAIRCPVTIEGSFHSRTISKVLEALVGYITRAIVGTPCTGGTATALTASLPWHIRYNGFTGTLPEIREIHLRLVNAGFLIQTIEPLFGTLVACLYQSTAASPMRGWIGREAAGQLTNLRVDETAGIPLFRQLAGFCPNPGKLRGTSNTITLLGATTRITVTLVQ